MTTQAHKEFDAWYRGVWPEESMNVKGHLHKNQMCAAWLASREVIVVTLPEIDPFETEANLHIDYCADRIKAAGLTVAYDKENDHD